VVTVDAPGVDDSASVRDEMPGIGSPAAILRSAEERLEAGGFEVDAKVLQGRPGATIREEIDEGGFELAVVGGGNRSRLGRLLLGSVSTKRSRRLRARRGGADKSCERMNHRTEQVREAEERLREGLATGPHARLASGALSTSVG
jgi:Universal stress protein family